MRKEIRHAMAWERSLSTHIWIFSVGRGLAAFVRSALNQGFIIDMGASDEFSPAAFVEDALVPRLSGYGKGKRRIAQAILSHPHSDHITECERLTSGSMHPVLLTCPHDKDLPSGSTDEKLNWNRIVNPSGSERLIEQYRSLYEGRELPLQTICFESDRTVPNLEYGVYYVTPPVCEDLHESDDNKYGNATSLIAYFRQGDHTVLLPGDITPEAMSQVLEDGEGVEKRYSVFDRSFTHKHPRWHEQTSDQPSMRSLLERRGLTVLVAPHHGLESGYPEALFDCVRGGRPALVVISERKHTKKTDGKIDQRYYSERGAVGLPVEIEGRGEKRRVLSTVSGHHILIVFSGTGLPKIYAEKQTGQLLRKLSSQRR
jgi:hypothetical protein